MQVEVTGMVLIASEVGDYDRRLVILTKERGKMSAFARGARKANSSLTASCQPFTYGRMTLHLGRESNHIQSFEVQNYFDELKQNLDGIMYGSYFCELADALTHENLDDREQLKLLYVTLRALAKNQIPYALIRRVYEIRALAIDGEEMQVYSCVKCGNQADAYVFRAREGGLVCVDHCLPEISGREILHPSTVYTLQYVLSTPLEKLYTFCVSDEVLLELNRICQGYLREYVDRTFKSEIFLDSMT